MKRIGYARKVWTLGAGDWRWAVLQNGIFEVGRGHATSRPKAVRAAREVVEACEAERAAHWVPVRLP